ncbi:MAG: hypothetical protein IJR70_03640 [Eubacterium sp.]|nr:hypothetical protein [Eubacterium sp.]
MAKTSSEKQLAKANKKLKKLGGFKYKDSNGLYSDYSQAYKDYANWLNNPKKYGYGTYSNDVDSLFKEVMNQKKFSYDPKEDKLFQIYKQQYMNQGNRAMQNQLGAAAAFSGGYNSSAAQTSAQNAYQNYLNALSDKAAETYQNALNMYRYNQQNMFDKYNAARDMNNAANEAYWKQAEARAQRMNSTYSAYNDDRNYQYNKFSTDRNFYQTQGKNALDQINWLKEYKLKKKQYKGG